jgi:hypothetical protein
VIGYSLFDETEKTRFLAEQSQRNWHWRHRLTRQQIEEQNFAVPGGTVTILNGQGKVEVLELFTEYLAIVGLEGEFADVNPVDWQTYAEELNNWYTQSISEVEQQEEIQSESD